MCSNSHFHLGIPVGLSSFLMQFLSSMQRLRLGVITMRILSGTSRYCAKMYSRGVSCAARGRSRGVERAFEIEGLGPIERSKRQMNPLQSSAAMRVV